MYTSTHAFDYNFSVARIIAAVVDLGTSNFVAGVLGIFESLLVDPANNTFQYPETLFPQALVGDGFRCFPAATCANTEGSDALGVSGLHN